MTEHKGLPVSGYQPQSEEKIALVNEFKQAEERLLRKIEAQGKGLEPVVVLDPRWASIARSHFEQGFMALNRAVFQPSRISLPEENTKD